MSIFDDIKGKAADLVHENKDAIRDGIGKAGDFIDTKTGGKYQDRVDSVQKSAEGFVEGLGGTKSAPAAEEAPVPDTTDERA